MPQITWLSVTLHVACADAAGGLTESGDPFLDVPATVGHWEHGVFFVRPCVPVILYSVRQCGVASLPAWASPPRCGPVWCGLAACLGNPNPSVRPCERLGLSLRPFKPLPAALFVLATVCMPPKDSAPDVGRHSRAASHNLPRGSSMTDRYRSTGNAWQTTPKQCSEI